MLTQVLVNSSGLSKTKTTTTPCAARERCRAHGADEMGVTTEAANAEESRPGYRAFLAVVGCRAVAAARHPKDQLCAAEGVAVLVGFGVVAA